MVCMHVATYVISYISFDQAPYHLHNTMHDYRIISCNDVLIVTQQLQFIQETPPSYSLNSQWIYQCSGRDILIQDLAQVVAS